MAEIASAFLPVVFQIAADFMREELRLEHDLESEVQLLKKNVNMINATLNDAKMNPSQPLKLWLDELRDVGYDAIDLLDEHNTEVQRRNLVLYHELRNRLAIVNPGRVLYRHDMSNKIREVSLKMSDVFQRRIHFGLNVNESSHVRDRLETTTSLPPTHIVGRENEKSEILKQIFPCDDVQVKEPKLSILAIHGMGRIGKTTLAQLIYNDEKTKKHFDMRLWVHVSYEFDIEKVTRSILESMDELSCPSINLDKPQKRIQKKLKGKRYLLVLDDFWNEKPHEWEKLIRPLHKGAPGSVIIVTTGTRLVAEMVSTFPSYPLKNLSEFDCYSLVAQYACHNDRHAIAELYALRSEIFVKCRGMPEEAIGLGDQLHREHDKEKWNEIIVKWGEGHTFPEERNGFINSMRLSYSRLPLNLKPCLAYCSIIPKGLQFEKEWIVQLWMAQNFISNQSEQRIEDIGNTYFDWLVERSFFQRTQIGLNKDRYEYSIPDMVQEVARHTSAEECCTFELGKPHNLASTTRHMSIVFTREQLSCTHDPFTKIKHCKGLYTLLVIGGDLINQPLRLPDDLLNSLGKLRALDLSYCNLGPLPTNIGDLKHLRYLQFRNSNIRELPKSISNLYNLQTLGLRNCYSLRKLPKKTRYLQKLLHLDLHLDYLHPNVNQIVPSWETAINLEYMPPYIGLLTNLQVLSRFVVSTREHCGLSELRNLNSLQGELLISNLDLVKNSDDAEKANLQEKRHIERLEFLWRVNGGLHRCSKEIITRTELVLENLKPNSSIKELNIVGYTGGVLPSWLGSTYYSHLHAIFLSDCTNCIRLPPLGNLPLLQNLHIKGMHSVKSIDCEFFCGNNPIRFPSLKKLVFENMVSVEKWSGHENCELSHLSELVLKDCANLQRFAHNFPSLTKLTIENLPNFVGLRRYPSLKYLKVVSCSDWIWDSWRCLSSLLSLTLSQLSLETLPAGLPKILNSLQSLEISHCNNLTMLPDDWIPPSVNHLCIRQCPLLRELPKGFEILTALEDLEIQDCKNLEFLPELKNLKSLTRLEISGCHSFVFFPSEGLPDALHFLCISDCPLFSRQFENLQSPDRIKIKHVFSVWIDQKHFNSSRIQGESST
ncbi:putative disease resistance protein RGA4 [Carex rostrata]